MKRIELSEKARRVFVYFGKSLKVIIMIIFLAYCALAVANPPEIIPWLKEVGIVILVLLAGAVFCFLILIVKLMSEDPTKRESVTKVSKNLNIILCFSIIPIVSSLLFHNLMKVRFFGIIWAMPHYNEEEPALVQYIVIITPIITNFILCVLSCYIPWYLSAKALSFKEFIHDVIIGTFISSFAMFVILPITAIILS
ncbi:MAG: hypothetical protein NT039_04855 [Candidatus Berkelbacteria bacterium]|nr:hypothetical protein [Candidatus Berkelbacteria bacterium]